MPDRRLVIIGLQDMTWGGIRTTIGGTADLTIVGDIADPEAALPALLAAEADVALIAAVVYGDRLVSRLSEIHQRSPQTLIVVVGDGFDPNLPIALSEADIPGYVVWSEMSLEMLHQFLALELDSKALPISLEAMRSVLDALGRRTGAITARERDVLALVVRGASNQTIAAQLVISKATVRTHIGNLMSKLGAKTRPELIAIAHERHLV